MNPTPIHRQVQLSRGLCAASEWIDIVARERRDKARARSWRFGIAQNKPFWRRPISEYRQQQQQQRTHTHTKKLAADLWACGRAGAVRVCKRCLEFCWGMRGARNPGPGCLRLRLRATDGSLLGSADETLKDGFPTLYVHTFWCLRKLQTFTPPAHDEHTAVISQMNGMNTRVEECAQTTWRSPN